VMSVRDIGFDDVERAAIEGAHDLPLPAHNLTPRPMTSPSPDVVAKARERHNRGRADDNDRAVLGLLPADPSEGMQPVVWEDIEDAANESGPTRVPPHDLLAERAVVASTAYGCRRRSPRVPVSPGSPEPGSGRALRSWPLPR
jgi:hypothetical protein